MNKLLKGGLIMTLVTAAYAPTYAQVFSKDADGFKTGIYTRDALISDWQTKSGNGFSKKGKGEDRVTVVKSTSPDTGNALKVKYPKGKADSKESGAQWETDLKGEYTELYLSYDVKFGANFEFVKPKKNTGRTGKLPGLGGGLSVDDKDDKNTAWDGKLQFRDKDELEFYVKTPVTRAKHFIWDKVTYTIAKDKWFNIEIRYKLNTVGKKNGIMQAWVDGKLFGEYKNAEFRNNTKVKINKMLFSTFYGGNPEADAPTRDVYAYFDNFIVSTKRINKKVGEKAGSTASGKMEIGHGSRANKVAESDAVIFAYPNPSSTGVFKLNAPASWSVRTLKGDAVISGNTNTIDLSTYAKGVYLVTIGDTTAKILVSGD